MLITQHHKISKLFTNCNTRWGIVVYFIVQSSAKLNSFARERRIERVVFYSIVGEKFSIVRGKFG